jgi:hypothetical protein
LLSGSSPPPNISPFHGAHTQMHAICSPPVNAALFLFTKSLLNAILPPHPPFLCFFIVLLQNGTTFSGLSWSLSVSFFSLSSALFSLLFFNPKTGKQNFSLKHPITHVFFLSLLKKFVSSTTVTNRDIASIFQLIVGIQLSVDSVNANLAIHPLLIQVI